MTPKSEPETLYPLPFATCHSSQANAPSPNAILGRAVRRALPTLLILALTLGAAAWLLRRNPAPPPSPDTTLTPPALPQRVLAEIPEVKFTDITAAAGITFVHNNGAYGDKLLPETMGGGVAFFDFDADGDPDLLFVNSTYWPDRTAPGKTPTTAALYRNDGSGRFTDVTAGSGLDVSLYGMGVAVGDYDNDGLADVFLTAVGENRLFHNEGNGQFRDATARPAWPVHQLNGAPAPLSPTSTTTATSTSSSATTSSGPSKSTSKPTTASSASAAPTGRPGISPAPSPTSTATTARAASPTSPPAAACK